MNGLSWFTALFWCSLSFNFLWWQICVLSRRESSRLFCRPVPAGVAPVGDRRTAGKRVWYCDREDTAISIWLRLWYKLTKTGGCFAACFVCVAAAIKIKVWRKRFWKCKSISYERTVKDKRGFFLLSLSACVACIFVNNEQQNFFLFAIHSTEKKCKTKTKAKTKLRNYPP